MLLDKSGKLSIVHTEFIVIFYRKIHYKFYHVWW